MSHLLMKQPKKTIDIFKGRFRARVPYTYKMGNPYFGTPFFSSKAQMAIDSHQNVTKVVGPYQLQVELYPQSPSCEAIYRGFNPAYI